MEAYPKQQNVQPKEQKVCQVPGCGKSYAKFKYLNRHLRSSHDLEAGDMYGHWLQKAEFLEGKGWGFAGLEAAFVGLSLQEDGDVDEQQVLCRHCDKKVSKRGCFKHMTNVHNIGKDDLQTWLTIKDANALHKHSGSPNYLHAHLYLTVAAHMAIAGESGGGYGGELPSKEGTDGAGSSQSPDASDQNDSILWAKTLAFVKVDENGICIRPVDFLPQIPAGGKEFKDSESSVVDTDTLAPTSTSKPTPPEPAGFKREFPAERPRSPGDRQDITQLFEQLEEISKKVGPRGIEVDVPKLQLSSWALAWQHPEHKKKRYTYPGTDSPHAFLSDFDWEPFKEYLHRQGVKHQTYISQIIASVQRFMSLLEIPDGIWNLVGVLCAIYKQSILPQLMKVPLMDVRYGWSRSIIAHIKHLVGYLLQECNRENWPEARLRLTMLLDEQLEGFMRRCLDYRKEADQLKWYEDADRLENFPELATIKAAVEQAMVDLGRIAQASADAIGAVDKSWLTAATTAVVGIIYYNSFAGRSGEWEAMTKSHVLDQAAAGKDFLVCHKHKTSHHYGSLAKYVPPGSFKAFEVYASLPGKITDLFLEPNIGYEKVYIGYHMKRFACHYLASSEVQPNCNLLRKQFHTLLMRLSREGKCMELLSKVDAHSARVAAKIYCTSTVSDDAKLGKMLYEAVYGNPVEWPAQRLSIEADTKEIADDLKVALCLAYSEANFEEEDDDTEEDDFILWEHILFPNLGLPVLADVGEAGTQGSSSSRTAMVPRLDTITSWSQSDQCGTRASGEGEAVGTEGGASQLPLERSSRKNEKQQKKKKQLPDSRNIGEEQPGLEGARVSVSQRTTGQHLR